MCGWQSRKLILTPLTGPTVRDVAEAFGQVEQFQARTFVLGGVKRTVAGRVANGKKNRVDCETKHDGSARKTGRSRQKMRQSVSKKIQEYEEYEDSGRFP